MNLIGTDITFRHPATRLVLTGTVQAVHRVTGELEVSRSDYDDSFVWVKPNDII